MSRLEGRKVWEHGTPHFMAGTANSLRMFAMSNSVLFGSTELADLMLMTVDFAGLSVIGLVNGVCATFCRKVRHIFLHVHSISVRFPSVFYAADTSTTGLRLDDRSTAYQRSLRSP